MKKYKPTKSMEKVTTKKDWKDSANKRRTRSLIGNGLIALFEVYDDIPITRHLMAIMKAKGDRLEKMDPIETGEGADKYNHMYLDDQAFLKEMETYTTKLQRTKTEEED